MSNVEQLNHAENINNLQHDNNNMDIYIRRNDLLKTLNRSQGISEKKSINKYFSNISLDAKNNRLFLTSKNATMQLNDSIPANIKKSGFATVNTNLLYEICRKLPESIEISIIFNNNTLSIKTSTSHFELPVFTNDDNHSKDCIENKYSTKITINATILRDIFNKVQFAISTDEVRYYLCGVYLELSNNNILSTATDGHRLASVSTSLDLKKSNDIPGIIIPKKTITEIIKMLKDETGDVDIKLYKNKVIFSWGVIKLTSNLIEGKFPPYQNAIPTIDEENMLIVETNMLKESIDRISSVNSEKNSGIKMLLTQNKLTLSAAATENGKANEFIEVKYTANNINIGFNAKYLLDNLFNIEDKEVKLLIKGSVDPVRIFDKKNPNTIYVIMPMRI